MKPINQTIEGIVQGLGLSYLYAYTQEANILLDRKTPFPCMVRFFSETLNVTQEAKGDYIQRNLLLYFADKQPIDAETATELDPICEDMTAKALAFIRAMRSAGYEILTNRIERTFGRFDVDTAGVVLELQVAFTQRC